MVSLPVSAHEAELVVGRLPVADRSLLMKKKCGGWPQRRLLAQTCTVSFVCHTDSVLLSLPRKYARLVRLCAENGLTGFTLKERGHVGIFRWIKKATRA